jgi:hypothetical protein
VLERDYCLAWFLVGLSQTQLSEILIFKGGTALKRCHFGLATGGAKGRNEKKLKHRENTGLRKG